MFRRADHLVVETETFRTRLSRRLGIPGKISVIRNSGNPLLLHEVVAHDAPTKRFGFLIPSAYYRHKNLEITPMVGAAMRQLDAARPRGRIYDVKQHRPSAAKRAPWLALRARLPKHEPR